MDERRREARIDVVTEVALTPLGSVEPGLQGQVLNVSQRGVKVRVTGPAGSEPAVGDFYRILTSRDRMLGRVSHSLPGAEGTEIGFRILYWSETGDLNQVVEDHSRQNPKNVLRELSLPRLYSA